MFKTPEVERLLNILKTSREQAQRDGHNTDGILVGCPPINLHDNTVSHCKIADETGQYVYHKQADGRIVRTMDGHPSRATEAIVLIARQTIGDI